MPSDLMKIARAANDPHLRWRAGAAQLLKAQAVITTTGGNPKEVNYAISVLLNPSELDNSMLALVASAPDVVAGTVVADEVPDTDAVSDDAIIAAVAANWGTVANRYPTNPLA